MQYTPMIQQYLEVKATLQDAIVFYRLGDFYEMFFEDAKIASKQLDLILTARGKNEKAIPMCGVPHHAANSYIQKLVSNGYKVAIVEQMKADPDQKIVPREAVKIITPGTILDDSEQKNNSYLLAIWDNKFSYTLLYCDHYNGQLEAKIIEHDASLLPYYIHQDVKEIIVDKSFDLNVLPNIPVSTVKQYEDVSQYRFLLGNHKDIRYEQTFELLMSYLLYTQKAAISHLQPLVVRLENDYLQIDESSKLHLELTYSEKNKKNYTLWGFLDECVSVLGSRLLKDWIEHPLVSVEKIKKRQNIIHSFHQNFMIAKEIKDNLEHIYDVKRLLTKVAYRSISPKELLKLKETLLYTPAIIKAMQKISTFNDDYLVKIEKLANHLENQLLEEVSTFVKDGNIFKDEVDEKLKYYRHISTKANEYILDLEQRERQKTNIKTLKIGYTRVFGYYIEVSKNQIANVKKEFGYIRRQTLANSERYTSSELKQYEDKLLGAKEKALEIEQELYEKLLTTIESYRLALLQASDDLAFIDAMLALSEVSSRYNYVCPTFGDNIEIIQGKHPILSVINQQYIANDYYSDETSKIMILTGPNMGGKSTFMRQCALITILAQIGCFVPAQKATLRLFTKLFTRMGASDNIIGAQSTFMMEMQEANYALRNADENSLILFDEIGRGTATYDGMAIAMAMVEYIATHIKATTIFSTHYHELVSLSSLENVENYHVLVHEKKDKITFLYQIVKGYASKSYGINVAKLAKIPNAIIEQARILLLDLQKAPVMVSNKPIVVNHNEAKLAIIDQLECVDVNQLTPIEAMLFLAELKSKIEDQNDKN